MKPLERGMSAYTVILALAAALSLVTPAQAERADRDKPVNIESDTLRLDDARKAAVYEGNVVLTQGTLLLTADRIDVRQDERGFNSGEATGVRRPVYFRQKVEGRDEYIEGTGSRLEYDAAREVVTLTGAARIKRGDEEVRGSVIVYDIRSGTYRAQGASPEGVPGRVRAVIKPKAGGKPGADVVRP